MLLKQLDIKNFRGIEELSLTLDDLCVLIGENNVGKSSVLDALRLCLTRSLTRGATVFDEYDYHLQDDSAEPTRAKPIEITLTFGERKRDEWPDEISQILSDAEQVDSDELRSIILRITSSFTSNDYVTEYNFLDLSGNSLIKANDSRNLMNLRNLVPTFYLASLRDAGKEFRARSQFWSTFIKAFEIDDQSRVSLERDLLELNKKILDQNTTFDSVKDKLRETANLLPPSDSDPVAIEVIPFRIFDILSRTQVKLTSKTGARIPIVQHGSGTQSLAVISLFNAFLQSRLKRNFSEHAEPLLALEEPEAHLHPSAIQAVGKMLQGIPGQKLMSTHSGDLMAGIPLSNIRRLRRRDGKIVVHRVEKDTFNSDEQNKLDYHIRATRGSLLFARCWILVEGETEATLLPECGRAMDYDLYADGVSCIEFAQVGVKKFIKLADQLGIEWFVLVDKDLKGEDYEKLAKDQLGSRPYDKHICMLNHGPMEVFLCMEGFGEIYESTISQQKRSRITAKRETLEYWGQVLDAQEKGAKTRNALSVANKILDNNNDKNVPELLQKVIQQALDLARSAV